MMLARQPGCQLVKYFHESVVFHVISPVLKPQSVPQEDQLMTVCEWCARSVDQNPAKSSVSVNCIPINTVKEINWDFLLSAVHTILADGRYQSRLKCGHQHFNISTFQPDT